MPETIIRRISAWSSSLAWNFESRKLGIPPCVGTKSYTVWFSLTCFQIPGSMTASKKVSSKLCCWGFFSFLCGVVPKFAPVLETLSSSRLKSESGFTSPSGSESQYTCKSNRVSWLVYKESGLVRVACPESYARDSHPWWKNIIFWKNTTRVSARRSPSHFAKRHSG